MTLNYANARYVYNEADDAYYLPLVNGILVPQYWNTVWVYPEKCHVHTQEKLDNGDLCTFHHNVTDEDVQEQLNCPKRYRSDPPYTTDENRCCCSGCSTWTKDEPMKIRNIENKHCLYCCCCYCVCDQRRANGQYDNFASPIGEFASGCNTNKCAMCDVESETERKRVVKLHVEYHQQKAREALEKQIHSFSF